MLKQSPRRYQYDRLNDESVYCVQITRDGESFADILFLNYLKQEQYRERKIWPSNLCVIVPIPPPGPEYEQYLDMRMHLVMDQSKEHLALMTHVLCRALVRELNGDGSFSDAHPRDKWISFSPSHYPNVIRMERDMGGCNFKHGLGYSAFADIIFANDADRDVVKRMMPAVLNEMRRFEEDQLKKLGRDRLLLSLQEEKPAPPSLHRNKRSHAGVTPR